MNVCLCLSRRNHAMMMNGKIRIQVYVMHLRIEAQHPVRFVFLL